jgi:hypothetical protein
MVARKKQAATAVNAAPATPRPSLDGVRFYAMRPFDVSACGGGLAALVFCRADHWSRHMQTEKQWIDEPPAWLTTWRGIAADLGLIDSESDAKARRCAHKSIKLAVAKLEKRRLILIRPCPELLHLGDCDGRMPTARQRVALCPSRVESHRWELPHDLPVSARVCNAVRHELLPFYGIDASLVLTQLLWRHALRPGPVKMGREKLRHQTGLSHWQVRIALRNLVLLGAVTRLGRTSLYEPRSWEIHPQLIRDFPPSRDSLKRRAAEREIVRQVNAATREIQKSQS